MDSNGIFGTGTGTPFLFSFCGSQSGVLSSPLREDQDSDDQDQQDRHCHKRHDVDRADLKGIGDHLGLAILVCDPMSSHQKPVGIDAIGGAGDQCAEVLTLFNLQVREIRGLHDADLIHLVGEGLVQDVQGEGIPLREFVQVRKELCRGKAPVPGQYGMGALPADRERSLLQVPDGGLQNAIAGAMVDRQLHVDLGNVDVPHISGAIEVQQAVVLLLLFFRHLPVDPSPGKLRVIFLCFLYQGIKLLLIHVCDGLGVVHDCPGLMEGVPVV